MVAKHAIAAKPSRELWIIQEFLHFRMREPCTDIAGNQNIRMRDGIMNMFDKPSQIRNIEINGIPLFHIFRVKPFCKIIDHLIAVRTESQITDEGIMPGMNAFVCRSSTDFCWDFYGSSMQCRQK